MNILIKGIDMPEHCYECLLRQGNCCLLLYEAIPPTVPLTRLDDCPLVEIPTPHGRLIDADKLRATLRRWTEDEWNQKASPVSWAYAYEDLIDLIDDTPTILEEEG